MNAAESTQPERSDVRLLVRVDIVRPNQESLNIGSGRWHVIPIPGDQLEVWTEDFGIWELIVVGRKWFATAPDVVPEFAAVLFCLRKEDVDATTQSR